MLEGVRLGVLVLALVAASTASGAAQTSLNRYDHVFQKYSKRYFGPGHDWRVFKAQGMAESKLNPSASSHAGRLWRFSVVCYIVRHNTRYIGR